MAPNTKIPSSAQTQNGSIAASDERIVRAEEEIIFDCDDDGEEEEEEQDIERGNSNINGTMKKPNNVDDASKTEDESATSFAFNYEGRSSNNGSNSNSSSSNNLENLVPIPPPTSKQQTSRTSKTIDSIRSKAASVVSAKPAKLPIMGGTANKSELTFVISAGILLAFNSGYINGSCLSGLLTPHGVTRSVSGFTGSYSSSALELAEHGITKVVGINIGMIFSFLFGSFITGVLTPDAKAYRIEPTYGPTFLLGGIALLIASVLAATEHDESIFFNFAAAANGIQNGISSSYSSNLIRTCHLTGTTTDIGLFLGQVVRGNLTNLWKLCVLSSLALSFWIGGIVSFYVTREYTSYSLLFNSGLFLLIGISLIAFLVHELHITVKAAMCGTWQWKQTLEKLSLSLRVENFASSRQLLNDNTSGGSTNNRSRGDYTQELIDLFDVIDLDKNGEITEDELLTALNAAGVKMKRNDVKVLMKLADKDNDGTISREEWTDIARMSMKGAGTLSDSIKRSIHQQQKTKT